MKKIITLLFIFINTTIHSQWNYIGLGFTNTSDLTLLNDTIYASTYDGIYKKSIHTSDTNWIACGLQANHVVQTFVVNDQTFISLVEIDSTYTTQIYKSVDAGNTFNLMTTDTSEACSYQFLDAMAYAGEDYDTLYFLNHHLKTYDGGITWDSMPAPILNDRFIKVNPQNHEQLIIGGETFILSAYLQISMDQGDNWSMPMMTDYFAGDNCVHDLVFKGNDWYAAGEGIICKTSDGGENWIQLLNLFSGSPNFSLYNFDIEVSNFDNSTLYVTGTNHYAFQVPLIYSVNDGLTWDTISFQQTNTINPNIHCLATHPISFGDKLYFGGNGVYTYESFFSSIDSPTDNFKVSIYPNPFQSGFKIKFDGKYIDHPLNLVLTDVLGNIVFEEALNSNHQFFKTENLSSGVYFLKIIDKNSGPAGSYRIVKMN
jgi:hypothetical protein